MSRRRTLEERLVRFRVSSGSLVENLLQDEAMRECVRAELNRLARQVRKIRKEVERPKGAIDAGYKTALTDVLALIKAAKR